MTKLKALIPEQKLKMINVNTAADLQKAINKTSNKPSNMNLFFLINGKKYYQATVEENDLGELLIIPR